MSSDIERDDVRRHVLFKRDGERSLAPEIADHMVAALDDGAEPDYQTLLLSARWPSPPPFAFHTAPRDARDSITAAGLRVTPPGSDHTDSAWPDPFGVCASQMAGVYVAERPDVNGRWSRWARWDVWRVAVTGLPWAPDPLNPRCWVVTTDIAADRVRLHPNPTQETE